jgi:ribonuclease Z
VLGEAITGTKLVHIGDAAHTDNLLDAAREADALVIEATYLHAEAELAQRFGHLTARQAAELAAEANVRALILTHLSRRYRERDVLDEARAIFPAAWVARDFDHYRVRRDASLEKVEQPSVADY